MHIVCPQGGSGGIPSRKMLDFRPSAIISGEYRAKIPRIMQTAARGVHACRCSAVIKRDIDYCDCECGVQGFPPRSLGNAKSRMGIYCLL